MTTVTEMQQTLDEKIALILAKHDPMDIAVDHDPRVRMSAAENPNATEEHLHKAMADEDYRVRRAAVRNDNVTQSVLQKALNDLHERVRATAENHPRYEELIGPHDAKI